MLQRNLLLAAVLLLAASARAAEPDPEGCKDSPLVQRFPGASMVSCEGKEFDEIEIPVGLDESKSVVTKTFEGKYMVWRYQIDSSKVSSLEVGRNYQNALKKAGAKILVDAAATNYPRQVTGLFEK